MVDCRMLDSHQNQKFLGIPCARNELSGTILPSLFPFDRAWRAISEKTMLTYDAGRR